MSAKSYYQKCVFYLILTVYNLNSYNIYTLKKNKVNLIVTTKPGEAIKNLSILTGPCFESMIISKCSNNSSSKRDCDVSDILQI